MNVPVAAISVGVIMVAAWGPDFSEGRYPLSAAEQGRLPAEQLCRTPSVIGEVVLDAAQQAELVAGDPALAMSVHDALTHFGTSRPDAVDAYVHDRAQALNTDRDVIGRRALAAAGFSPVPDQPTGIYFGESPERVASGELLLRATDCG